MLNIDPDKNLFPDQYFIKTRLSYGLTSMFYQLIDKNNYLNSRLLKICRHEIFNNTFLNELSILTRLKQFNNGNNFNLFFSNIEQSSPEGKIFLLNKSIGFSNSDFELIENLLEKKRVEFS